MEGEKFGSLTVVRVGFFTATKKVRPAVWAVCECGMGKFISVNSLRTGNTKKCGLPGCRLRAGYKHGGCGTAEYRIWSMMIGRCRPDSDRKYYSAKGIKVCSRWGSFANFLKDMGNRPSAMHSIDRIDGGGDYSPANCRWATPLEQGANISSNIYAELNGENLHLLEWSRRLAIPVTTLYRRHKIGERGSTLLRASKRQKFITFRGQQKTTAEWARSTGLPVALICNRVKNGWPEHALFLSTDDGKVFWQNKARSGFLAHKQKLLKEGRPIGAARALRPLSIGGKTQFLHEWAEQAGIKHWTLAARLRAGWPPAMALAAPADIARWQASGRPGLLKS